jgi:hypothetical protein
MPMLLRRLAAVALGAALFGSAAACNTNPTFPTPTIIDDELSGTVEPGGESFQTFTVEYPFTGTDATVTIVSLTLAATGEPLDTTIGVGFGTITGSTCTRAGSSTQNDAAVGQEYTTQGSLFFAGTYCLSVFDASGTLPGPTNYVLRVRHY